MNGSRLKHSLSALYLSKNLYIFSKESGIGFHLPRSKIVHSSQILAVTYTDLILNFKKIVYFACVFLVFIYWHCTFVWLIKFLINDNAVYYCQKIWRFYTICQLTFLSRTIKTFSSDLLFSHGWRIQSAHWCVFPI